MKVQRWSTVSFFCLIFIMAISCSSSQKKEATTEDKKFEEGVIVYKIEYPERDTADFMLKMLPDSMYLSVKNGMCRTEIGKGKMFRQIRITKEKEVILMVQMLEKRVGTMIDSTIFDDQILPKNPLVFHSVEKEETDRTYAGFNSSWYKAFDSKEKSFALFVTDEVAVNHPNLYSQYHDINDVLLEYYTQRFGLAMRYTAVRVEHKKIDDSLFEFDSTFVKISFNKYMHLLNPPIDYPLGPK
jgi:arsenate reductase-like glutaredoxin family protein